MLDVNNLLNEWGVYSGVKYIQFLHEESKSAVSRPQFWPVNLKLTHQKIQQKPKNRHVWPYKLKFRQTQLAVYTVVHEEFDFDLRFAQFWPLESKNWKKQILKKWNKSKKSFWVSPIYFPINFLPFVLLEGTGHGYREKPTRMHTSEAHQERCRGKQGQEEQSLVDRPSSQRRDSPFEATKSYKKLQKSCNKVTKNYKK